MLYNELKFPHVFSNIKGCPVSPVESVSVITTSTCVFSIQITLPFIEFMIPWNRRNYLINQMQRLENGSVFGFALI
jgi:hypothetical protein